MTFEEKKQEIIKMWIAHELKQLQPDKPKCSTCKYLKEQKNYYCGDINMGDKFKCINHKTPFDNNVFCENGEEHFGCIYHEEE